MPKPKFRPRARLMLLLGDQLIRDAGVAVFELVKNAYDADAENCDVLLKNVATDTPEARIIVSDNGVGMDKATVENVWLEPGTRNRKGSRSLRTFPDRIPDRAALTGTGLAKSNDPN